MRPFRTSSQASRNRRSLRCWLPVWKTTLFSRTALNDVSTFLNAKGERFLSVDVFLGLCRGEVDQGVPMIRRGIDHCMDVIAFEELTEVGELSRCGSVTTES